MVTLAIRQDLWSGRKCSMCEDPVQGPLWKAEWGCEKPTANLIFLGPDLTVDRCPLALFREHAGDTASQWANWAVLAVPHFHKGNWQSYLGPNNEISALGGDVLTLALGAASERERAEYETAKEKAAREAKNHNPQQRQR